MTKLQLYYIIQGLIGVSKMIELALSIIAFVIIVTTLYWVAMLALAVVGWTLEAILSVLK